VAALVGGGGVDLAVGGGRRCLLAVTLVAWAAMWRYMVSHLSAFEHFVIKAIGNNEEQKGNHSTETQDFNMENPLQQREVKTTGASQQNFTISGVFTNAVGNPNDAINHSWRLTRSIYICGSNDPYQASRRRASLHSIVSLLIEFGSTYNTFIPYALLLIFVVSVARYKS
jgi:hypothetical protein